MRDEVTDRDLGDENPELTCDCGNPLLRDGMCRECLDSCEEAHEHDRWAHSYHYQQGR